MEYYLIPKDQHIFFWHHRNFGQVRVIAYFGLKILIEGGDEEYLSYALNLTTFENMSPNLWPNMLLFSRLGTLDI